MMCRALFAAVLCAACAAPQEYRGAVGVRSAQLIALDPDVKVVADADQPLFFAAGSYWLFHDGGWYRGAGVAGPFVRERKPPWQIRKVDQPFAFTHYALRDRTAVHQPQATEPKTKPEPAAAQRERSKLFDFE